jgi:SCY1-like protein 1
MGNSSSSLPYSIDNQVGAPHDHNGWALHRGKSTDGNQTEVSVFVGKKPILSKTPVNPRFPGPMQLVPALHHYNHCRKLRHPQILKVYATLDTDNPAAASTDGGAAAAAAVSPPASAASSTATGDLIVVTEPCIPLSQWLLERPTSEQLAWGLECVVKGLHFLHQSAKLAHGNISPSSLYVTKSGDVKLWNFSLVTPVGPDNGGGPTIHFQQLEQACTPDMYRGPERQSRAWNQIENAGIHVMDSYSLGVLIADYWYNAGNGVNHVPAALQKAVQRMQTPNLKMRPRLQPLLKCPVFDTPYQKLQWQLEEITVQPVEQKVQLWQQLGQQLQSGQGMPKDVALYKILPLIILSVRTITGNESMLGQDMYRREGKKSYKKFMVEFVIAIEHQLDADLCVNSFFCFLKVLATLIPLFYIEEHYQEPSRIGKELAPLVAKLFLVPDRGVRGVLLNRIDFLAKHLDKNALNSSVFEPMCSGFNDSSPALREMTLKATLCLVPSLHAPSIEKLSRYLVRLQADSETSIRTNSVIFIAKLAPHLSEVSKQKMLLPAYRRGMRDTFAPCRLAALQSTLQSKSLFSIHDLATSIAPSVMPLTLDPMPDVRKEAFRVLQTLLKDLEQESERMERIGIPTQQEHGQPQSSSSNGNMAPAPTSGGSSSYLSGLSSWVVSSAAGVTQPSGTMSITTTTPTTSPSKAVAPASAPALTMPTPPVKQIGSMAISISAQVAAVDEGWGEIDDDDDDDEGWGDDEDMDGDPFAKIGTKTGAAPATAPSKPAGGFSANGNDPFASFGIKSTTKPQSSGGTLVLPQKNNLATKKVALPAATKLTIDDDDVGDGWDDF